MNELPEIVSVEIHAGDINARVTYIDIQTYTRACK